MDLLENGTAAEDTLRAAYIYHEALAALHQVSHGVPVKGCIHWSLLDNYESSLSYNNKLWALLRLGGGYDGSARAASRRNKK